MYAVVVRESGDAEMIDRSREMVRSDVAPVVRGAPGFVSAVWMTDQAGGTLNVFVFDSQEAASSALDGARSAPRPPFIRLERVDLFDVLATA